MAVGTKVAMSLVSVMSAELGAATGVDTALMHLSAVGNFSLDRAAAEDALGEKQELEAEKAQCTCTFGFDNKVADAYMVERGTTVQLAWDDNSNHGSVTFACTDVSMFALEGYDYETGCPAGGLSFFCTGGAPWGGLTADTTFKVYSLADNTDRPPVVYGTRPANWNTATFDDSTWNNAQFSTYNAAAICDSGGKYWLFRKTIPSLMPAPSSAVGDPHLQNIYGERFDLMKPGKVVLIHIPRGKPVKDALLVVEADAVRLGGQCADMYFQMLNITGAWADKAHAGGLRFDAGFAPDEQPQWLKLGPVKVKVARGRTDTGLLYLNFYIKYLKLAGFDVGGVLGADDHTEAATPTSSCQNHIALSPESNPESPEKSVASATLG